MTKLALALCALALAAAGLVACGGDDDETTTEAATTTEETTTEAGGGGAETALAVTADPNGALAYEESSLEAPAGALEIGLDNPASIPHNVCVESPDGEDLGCSDVVTGDTSSVSVDASEPGEYVFYCSVDAHREGGMEGPLTIE